MSMDTLEVGGPPQTHVDHIVLLGGREDYQCLLAILQNKPYRLTWKCNQEEVAELCYREEVAVLVLCEEAIIGMSWHEFARRLRTRAFPPLVLVSRPFVDGHYWAKVLLNGGFDVLERPFTSHRSVWLIERACLRWNREREKEVARKKQLSRMTPAEPAGIDNFR